MLKNEKKIALLEEMMELDSGTLKEETVLDDFEKWDSMAAILLIGLVDEKFNKKLTAKEIKNFKTISDILKFMG